ncbi:MAG: hypothetical protein AAFP86_15630, partial [Planctomycetota bacterium]
MSGPIHRHRQYRREPNDDPRLARALPGGSGAGPGGASALPASGAGAQSPEQQAEIEGFGMTIFLASLTMVFGGVFAAYLIIWFKNRADWQGIVDGREMSTLALATVLLVAADLASARALKVAADKPRAWSLTRLGAAVATVYLVVQSFSWFPLLAQANQPGHGGTLEIEGFLFLMLTFSHAVHVLGGIIANVVVLGRARSTDGPRPGTLRLLYKYWRFLTLVWVAVLATLFALGRMDVASIDAEDGRP